MSPQELEYLQTKQYEKVILPYSRIAASDRRLLHVRDNCEELLDYMLANDPESSYTLLAADNLYRLSIDSGDIVTAELCQGYIKSRMAAQNIPIPYIMECHPELPKVCRVSSRPESLGKMLKDIKNGDANSVKAMLSFSYTMLIHGYVYLAGLTSEHLSNGYIDKWNEKPNPMIMFPMECTTRLLISALILYRKSKPKISDGADAGIRHYRLCKRRFMSPVFRFYFMISTAFELWLKDDKTNARSLLRFIERYIDKHKHDMSMKLFEDWDLLNMIGSVIDPERVASADIYNTIIHVRHLLSLAKELFINGDIETAHYTCLKIRLDIPEFKNALYYPFLAEYWGLMADIYGMLDNPTEQASAVNQWLSYTHKVQDIEKNARDALVNIFSGYLSDMDSMTAFFNTHR